MIEWLPLEEVAKVDRTAATAQQATNMPYVGLEHIKADRGIFVGGYSPLAGDVKATKFLFTSQHILYGKLRPYLNKRLRPAFDGVCSTEILPILPKAGKADRYYLFHYLGTKNFVDWASDNVSGANLPRLSPSLLSEAMIPYRPLLEQQAIAQRLERADRLRRLRQHALNTGDQYLQNVFLDMFGDPETNPKGWEREELGELMAVPPQIGTTQPAGSSGKQRCVRVGEIGSYYVDLEACGFVNLDEKNLRKYRLAHEDLLLARAIGSLDHLGKMSIVHDTRDDLVYDSHVMRLRLDSSRLLPRFLMTMLVTPGGRSLFLKQARRTAVQFNVNADQMKALPVLVPKLSEQKRFVAVVQKYERLRRMQVEALRQAEQLYETLLEEAFGEQPLENP